MGLFDKLMGNLRSSVGTSAVQPELDEMEQRLYKRGKYAETEVTPESAAADQASQLPPDLQQRLKTIDTGIRNLSAVSKGKKGEEKQSLLDRIQSLQMEKDAILSGEVESQIKPSTEAGDLDLGIGKEGPKTIADTLKSTGPATSPTPAAGPATPSLQAKVAASGVGEQEAKAVPDYFQQAEAKRKEGEGTLQAKLAEAESKREEARGRADIGQLAETVGRSLAQIGAAQAGMKSGFDLSQAVAKAPGVDWEARRKEIQGDYDRRIATAESAQKQLDTEIDRLEKRGQYEDAKQLEKKKMKLQQDVFDFNKQKTKDDLDIERGKIAATQGVKNLERSQQLAADYDKDKRTEVYRDFQSNYSSMKELEVPAKKGNAQAGTAMLTRLARGSNPTGQLSDNDMEQVLRRSYFDKFGVDLDKSVTGNVQQMWQVIVEKKQADAVIDAAMETMRATGRGLAKAQGSTKERFKSRAESVGASPEFVFAGDEKFERENPEIFKEGKEQEKTGPEGKGPGATTKLDMDQISKLPVVGK